VIEFYAQENGFVPREKYYSFCEGYRQSASIVEEDGGL